MGMNFETKGKQQMNVYYVDAAVPCVVEEKFGGYFDDYGVPPLAENLQAQESVYKSFQRNARSDATRASSSNTSRNNNDHVPKEAESNSSTTASVKSQLARDEALARELQDLENQLAGTSLGRITGTEADANPKQSSSANVECNSTNLSVQVTQDDIDPDDMTYEELQRLGEAMGTESRGLSDELISFLPTSTYKVRLFSKKENLECVICYMAYENRDELITLPCQHQYHKTCVTKWLKINKACPVCFVEVFGS